MELIIFFVSFILFATKMVAPSLWSETARMSDLQQVGKGHPQNATANPVPNPYSGVFSVPDTKLPKHTWKVPLMANWLYSIIIRFPPPPSKDVNARVTVFAPVNDVFLYNPDLRAMDQKEVLSHIGQSN
jgi:hypothetical protein